ncbi:MAG: hypothetical protein M1274_15745 [Actinobacteria bacterium]|nr:hypothetical protein [Actinomycetota bacterium]
MAYLICKVTDEALVREACNPTGPVEGGMPGVRLDLPVRSVDGRALWGHPWDTTTLEWLEIRIAGITGAVVVESWPGDFVAAAA